MNKKKMKRTQWANDLPTDTVYGEMSSPVGKLTMIASSQGLHAIIWDTERQHPNFINILNRLTLSENQPILVKTKQQLNEYFQAKRGAFDLPLVLKGTDFQIQVWKQLLNIPYAQTISYAEQAGKMGNRNKARAVGMANGLNPILIIIPCHRVIGSSGHLVGFGGGLDKKAYLLKLEQNSVIQHE